jgi:hypothetical protein
MQLFLSHLDSPLGELLLVTHTQEAIPWLSPATSDHQMPWPTRMSPLRMRTPLDLN